MKLLVLASLILLHCANAAQAIDRVQIRAPRVNVRAAPSVKSKILTKLSRGKVVKKIGEHGKWTKIHLGPTIPLAWIYSPLLSPLPGPFARFQEDYTQLNKVARSARGADLFIKAQNSGNDVIYIETSTVWNTLSAREQTSYIESLYQSWKEANDGKTVTLHLYDGKTHRLRSDLSR
jgi:SH3-like domain-containing protein